jgi:hypothetical protein
VKSRAHVCFLLLTLVVSCATEDPAPRWTRLAVRYAGDPERSSAVLQYDFTIAREDWVWYPNVKIWGAALPATAEALRLTVLESPRLFIEGREIELHAPSARRSDVAHAWFAAGKLLLNPGADPDPGDARLAFTVLGGERVEYASGPAAWRVRAERLTADGFRVWEGRPVELRVTADRRSALRFATAFVASAGGLRVFVGETLVYEHESDAPESRTRHVVPLENGLSPEVPLRFETYGERTLATVLAPVIGPLVTGATRADRRPDIILFSADTFRADNLTSYGGEWGVTPNLDRFAAQSVRFARAWSPSIWTLPSHTSMLLGLYPYEHGSTNQSQSPSGALVSIAERLSAAGYRTGAVTDGRYVTETYGMDRGFEWFETRDAVSLRRTIASALDILDADDGRPTFLFVHTYRMHAPYRATSRSVELYGEQLGLTQAAELQKLVLDEMFAVSRKELANGEAGDDSMRAMVGREDWSGVHARVVPSLVERGVLQPGEGTAVIAESLQRLYIGGLADFDMHMGVLFDQLRARGREEDTVFLFTSDHGEAFGEHGMLFHNHGTWNEALQIPLLVRAPGLDPGVSTIGASLVDVAPTIAALADVAPDSGWSGRGLLAGASDGPVFAYDCARFIEHTGMIVDGKWKLSLPLGDAEDSPTFSYLYDLERDPDEHDNLVDDEPQRAREIYERWRAPFAITLQRRGEAGEVSLTARERQELEALGYTGVDD